MDGGQPTAEQPARVLIDRQRTEAGWSVENRSELNLFAAQDVAVREVDHGSGTAAPTISSTSTSAVGASEAKPEVTCTLRTDSGVRLKALITAGRLLYVFKASGPKTHFTTFR